MTGDKALQAKVGERVRLFVGDAGPNLTSSFHVIGEIFDKGAMGMIRVTGPNNPKVFAIIKGRLVSKAHGE